MLCNMDVEQVILANYCIINLHVVIYFWLHADLNNYRIRSYIFAQECPRIDGFQRLMVYSPCATTQCCSCNIQTCTFGDYGVQWTKLCKESVSEHCHCFTCTFFTAVICLYSNLYTYKASECKRAIIRLHYATSKSSLWHMGYVPVVVPLNAHASIICPLSAEAWYYSLVPSLSLLPCTILYV